MERDTLAAMRQLERRDAVRRRLTADRARVLAEPRPAGLAVFVAATSDGACAVVPLLPADVLAPRRRRLAAAAAGALAVAAGLGPPLDGRDAELEGATWAGFVAVRVATEDGAGAVELVELSLADEASALDRFEPVAVAAPEGTLEDTEPLAAGWLWPAEMTARLGGRAAAASTPPELAEALAALGATRPPEEQESDAAAAHDDPLVSRRIVRRILRRLDGMGKYGGFHTEFAHLARGFPGHERALALEAGEALLRAGLLDEKPSVGQRHVALVAARTAEIRRLVEHGDSDDAELAAFFERRG